MAKDQEKHLHSGHRARMQERFLQTGGEGMADHELLELLLFYVIPRRDTNDLAHRLMEDFGSLSGVLEADRDLLRLTAGIGDGSAAYLKLLGELTKRYTAEKLTQEDRKTVFDTPGKIAAYMASRYMGVHVERVYLLLFDNGMHLIDCFHVCDGSVAGVTMSVRRIAERAYRKGAAAAILTHNHPDGMAIPSPEDMRVTRRVEESLRLLEVPLLEHYVFANRTYAPILAASRAENEEAYAASSLFDILNKKLHEQHSEKENRHGRP